MTRQQLLEFVEDEFSVLPDFPFDKDFETAVLRHKQKMVCTSYESFKVETN